MPVSTNPRAPLPPPDSEPQRPPSREEQSEYQKGRTKYNQKAFSEYFDPCQEAASRSLKCMQRNPGDRDLCSDYFQAYRDCKKRWMDEMKEEKRKATAWW